MEDRGTLDDLPVRSEETQRLWHDTQDLDDEPNAMVADGRGGER